MAFADGLYRALQRVSDNVTNDFRIHPRQPALFALRNLTAAAIKPCGSLRKTSSSVSHGRLKRSKHTLRSQRAAFFWRRLFRSDGLLRPIANGASPITGILLLTRGRIEHQNDRT